MLRSKMKKLEGEMMGQETIGEVPEIPEVPKRPRKTLIAILLVLIVGVSAVSVFIWWYTQRTPTHNLKIQSTPITEIQFTKNGVTEVTSYFKTLEEGDYTIVMPTSVTEGTDVYNFNQWEDGSTDPTRTVNLTADVTFTATYVLAPTLYNTYSKYGFSFEYPKGMVISESATSSSGQVSGQLFAEDSTEGVVVKWLAIFLAPYLEFTLNDEMEHLEAGGYDVDRGQIVTSTKAGHEMMYQYFTATSEVETAYGIFGVWYCDINDRLYELCFMSSESDVLSKFQQYLDSFVCHE